MFAEPARISPGFCPDFRLAFFAPGFHPDFQIQMAARISPGFSVITPRSSRTSRRRLARWAPRPPSRSRRPLLRRCGSSSGMARRWQSTDDTLMAVLVPAWSAALRTLRLRSPVDTRYLVGCCSSDPVAAAPKGAAAHRWAAAPRTLCATEDGRRATGPRNTRGWPATSFLCVPSTTPSRASAWS